MLGSPQSARLAPSAGTDSCGFGVIGVGYAVPLLPRVVQPMEKSSSNLSPQGDGRKRPSSVESPWAPAPGLTR